MKIVALAESCEFIKDGTHNTPEKVSQGVPVLSAGNVYGGQLSFETDRFATEEELVIFRKRLHPKIGDVLLTIVGTIGRAAVLTEDRPLIFQRSVCVLRPIQDVLDSLYFRYVLESEFVKKQFEKEQQGVAQMGIYLETLNEIQIPLPPLTEQKRIASLLARADRLRTLRRTAHELGESLLQSVFLEMFGDPVRNEKKWEEKNLNELCRNITDGTHDTPDRTSSGVPFITSKNIRPYEIDLSVLEYVSEETHQEIIKRTNPQYGDVIYTNIGANLGNAAMNKLPFSFSLKNVALLQPNKKLLNSYYLEALLNNERFKENLIYLSSAGGAQQFVTLEILRTISIPYPSLSLQEEFAGVVARVESLRGRMSEAGRQVEGLFEALLAESFS